jgi:hypothetical protein
MVNHGKYKGAEESAPVERTSDGLRDALFDEIENIRNEETTPQRANALSKLAAQIISTVNMEIEFHKHVQKMKDGEPQARTQLDLGRRAIGGSNDENGT